MTRTNQKYIHEFDFFDCMRESVAQYQESVIMATYDYDRALHQIEMIAMFEEAAEADTKKEKASEGLLEKIGNAVMAMIKQIGDFLGKIVDTVTGSTKTLESDAEKVTRMMKEHPELQETVAKGIKKEWFTYADIASFEKDFIGLINMVESKRMSHRTFTERVSELFEGFHKKLEPVAKIGADLKNVTNIVTFLPVTAKGIKESKDVLSGLRKGLEDFNITVKENYAQDNVPMYKAVLGAFGKAIGIATEECEQRVAKQGTLSKFLHGLASKNPDSLLSKAVSAHDDRVESRKSKAGFDATAKRYGNYEKEVKKEYEKEVEKQKRDRDLNDRLKSTGYDPVSGKSDKKSK